ncbi:MAG: ribosome biogenesis GTPase Der [Actinomycetales bacterium]|nr:ribosome biogenesis GTPase Der [Actinomycetales bacterium]
MTAPLVIAVDGPAGSGKSSVCRGVASRLEWRYLDTGAMYRAMTWAVLRAGIPSDDAAAVAAFAHQPRITSGTDPAHPTIEVDGHDVADAIRGPEVTAAVSAVSAVPEVRARLVELQREQAGSAIASGTGIIVEGRDIGTVVLPDAPIKVFLTADAAERARRRAGEQLDRAGSVADVQASLAARDAQDASRAASPMAMADDALLVDTTHEGLQEVIDRICTLIRDVEARNVEGPGGGFLEKADLLDPELAGPDDIGTFADSIAGGADDGQFDHGGAGGESEADLAAAVAAARAEFGDFDLELEELRESQGHGLPVLAIVGRPNVGKSTLVNRIIGRREAVVEDIPGVTRDRVAYEAEWNGRRFQVVDTGGWDRRARGMAAQVASQAERAIAEADAVAFVVDASVGVTDADAEVVKVLRRCGRPVVLIANKVDGPAAELEAASLWSLGLGEPHCVSALHGRGSGDLLDVLVQVLPEHGQAVAREGGPSRVALLGKPNVGKSSLLNSLAAADRVVVDAVAGTTVDPVDELVWLDEEWWWFVDTAGIRRRASQASGHEYYATLRTQSALDRAQVAIVLVDASEPLAEQDVRIISMVIESGRALVLAFNKWDLTDQERRDRLEREISRDLVQVPWAPRVNISARTGRHVDRIAAALRISLDGWQTRVSTGRLNQFMAELAQSHPHPLRGGRQSRILFAAQVAVGPPTFALFTTGFLEAGYRRFIERRLREEFGFAGTPIRIVMRVREKRSRR